MQELINQLNRMCSAIDYPKELEEKEKKTEASGIDYVVQLTKEKRKKSLQNTKRKTPVWWTRDLELERKKMKSEIRKARNIKDEKKKEQIKQELWVMKKKFNRKAGKAKKSYNKKLDKISTIEFLEI